MIAEIFAWVIVLTGVLVWIGIGLLIVGNLVGPSAFVSFGCARCDWAIRKPSRLPWLLLRTRYRVHCVRVHRDWPPQFNRPSGGVA